LLDKNRSSKEMNFFLKSYFSNLERAPKFSDKQIAQSFPLGNINPYIRSKILIQLYLIKFAVVPIILAAFLLT
jgi:hypothetical protein